MVTRREALIGLGILGAGGVGGAVATGGMPDLRGLSRFLGGRGLRIGVSTEFGPLTVSVTDVAVTRTAKFVSESSGRSWEAPRGAKLVLFKVEVTNQDITDHEGPAFSPSRYTTLQKDPDKVYVGDVNDIRVFGEREGGIMPEIPDTNLSYREFEVVSVYGIELDVYPIRGGGNGPNLEANQTVSGWVYGLIETGQRPRLKMVFNGGQALWRHDVSKGTVTPIQNETIEV